MTRIMRIALCAPFLLVLGACGDREPQEHSAGALEEGAAGLPPQRIGRVVELFNKGIGLMDQYRPAEAAEAFGEVVRQAPDWTAGRLNLGIALLNAQSDELYPRAEKELERAAAEEPDNPCAHFALGILLVRLSRFDEACARFERVVRIDPGDPDAHYQLGSLLSDGDPAAARAHFEKTLEASPHHESACYRLMNLLRQAGENERADELLQRFRTLKSTGTGIIAGIKYGEMGRYAEVVRCLEPGAAAGQEPQDAPVFADVAAEAGLGFTAAGVPGWPGEAGGEEAARGPGAFAPGVAVADIDGDGDLDLYITAAGPDAAGVLCVRDEGRFAVADESGIDGRNAIGAFFGDYDRDGDPDLYLTCAGPNRLYRNDGGARFADVTAASGTAGGAVLNIGAAWADADHDGDLDLYVAGFAPWPWNAEDAAGAPNRLFRNNSDGTFVDVAQECGVDGGDAATMAVVFLDVDDDRDADLYLVNHRSANRLFLNDRAGLYRDAASRFAGLADGGPGTGALVGDADQNGLEDLLLLRGPEPARLFLQTDRGVFVEDHAFGALARGAGGAVGGLMGDLDLDGDLDVVLLGTGAPGGAAHQVFMNSGAGRFGPPAGLGARRALPDARGAVAADFDGKGSLELLVARAGAAPELWQCPVPAGRHWLEVCPSKSDDGGRLATDPTAIGMHVEVKTGRRLQVGRVVSSAGYLGSPPPRAHFGLGGHGKADYVRLLWSDSVLQGELEVASDAIWRIAKMARKPSSCPVLFCWDGERFAFVTDFLGTGGVGFFLAPGVYAPPDPTEDVRIPPALVAQRDGRIVLRVAEPLEEVAYIDQLQLVAYDHPAQWEIHPDERFAGAPPFPTGRPYAAAAKIFPAAARDHRGRDVLDRIRAIDRCCAEPPKDRRFVGYAEDHWLELDFGGRLREIGRDARLVLYLYGWVEYTYSHVNYAAYHAGVAMRAPAIEIPDDQGGWRTAVADAGYPAGLPRMMTLDISQLPIREEGRLRIRTNMEIFWDQIFAAEDAAGPELRCSTLEPAVALLRGLGYPREYSPDGRDPTLYDYHRIDLGVPFKNMAGDYTRFGDVRPLLKRVDDCFVIMGRGEEIALEFDAAGLPPLPAGWARTFVLHADGYCKDMDLYTAFPDTVGPLPHHGMQNYPPETAAPEEVEASNRIWNTRRISDR